VSGLPAGVHVADARQAWLACWGRAAAASGGEPGEIGYMPRWWAYVCLLGQAVGAEEGGGRRTERVLVTRWIPGSEVLPAHGHRYGRRVRRVVLAASVSAWPCPPVAPGDRLWWGLHLAATPLPPQRGRRGRTQW
jgi:hypothetical protein